MHDLKMIADKALAALKDKGADKAQCAVRFTETHEFNVDGGKFSLFRTLFDNSLSLTAPSTIFTSLCRALSFRQSSQHPLSGQQPNSSRRLTKSRGEQRDGETTKSLYA